jgi:hypothetical protein
LDCVVTFTLPGHLSPNEIVIRKIGESGVSHRE